MFQFKDKNNLKWFSDAVRFVEELIMSKIDSSGGVKVTVDAPAGNNHMLSVIRPGVMRQEYGLNLKRDPLLCNKRNYVPRYFYGTSDNKHGYSQVGTHPMDQYTLPMNPLLCNIAERIVELVQGSPEFKETQRMKRRNYSNILFKKINHCSVLIYFGLKNYKSCSTLSSHCDNTYRPSGTFVHSMNAQVEDTPTITLTIGDPRTIHYKRRCSSNGKTWDDNMMHLHSDILSHGTVNVIHPDDERPFEMTIGKDKKVCQIQHGDIKVGKDQMSITLVFRTVRTISLFDKNTHQREIKKDIPMRNIVEHQQLHESLDKKDFEKRFQKLFIDVMRRNPRLA